MISTLSPNNLVNYSLPKAKQIVSVTAEQLAPRIYSPCYKAFSPKESPSFNILISYPFLVILT